jgi:hypothetical protein
MLQQFMSTPGSIATTSSPSSLSAKITRNSKETTQLNDNYPY